MVNDFNDSWQQKIPNAVLDNLLAGQDGILYFYRSKDHLGALIDTHLLL